MIRGIGWLLLGCLAWPGLAEPLRIGVSLAIPPYVIREQDRGIELDLLREAFAGTPYQPEFNYLSLRQTFEQMEQGHLDGIINVRPGMLKRGYLSQPAITFHNYVFTLTPLRIERLEQLANLNVVAFQRASDILGSAFANAIRRSRSYQELARQELQVKQLFEGRAQAIVLEERIFLHYLGVLAASEGAPYDPNRVIRNDLFPATVYHFAFDRAELRDRFDQGLAAMRADGRYERIFSRYQQQK